MKNICSIIVKNSLFFTDDFSIHFSDKLNCLMGGRGTGKSTILYFIKSALENESEEDKTINSLLKANLKNGTIILTLQDEDGKFYEIIKTYGDYPQLYSLPQKRNISMDSLIEIFDCDIYPTLSIEEIGKNSLSRLELIDKKIKLEVNQKRSEINKLQIDLNQNAVILRGENARIIQLKDQLLNYLNAEDDLKKHKEDKPEDIGQKEESEFEKADSNEKIRNSEKRFTKKILTKLSDIKLNLEEFNEDMNNFLNIDAGTPPFINKDIISDIRLEMKNILWKIINDNKLNIDLVDKAISKIDDLITKLMNIHSHQQNDFVILKQKFDKHKEYINKYNQLSKKVEQKNILLKEVEELESKRNKLKKQRTKLIIQLNDKKKEIYLLRKNILDDLNTELEGSIKITLTFGGITEEYENNLRNALRGSNMRYNAIIPNIVQSLTPDKFAKAIHEQDVETLKIVAQIDSERSIALIEALFESEEIYKIECLYCEDFPEFFLKVDAKGIKQKADKENYKSTNELSTGQRCTTVLPIVFAVSDNPLIIDQPEDNLDNRYITETIHKIIREQKVKRQLIFITHNPNIPVLSDAELNLFLNYEDKKSRVDSKGTVDDVKKSILNLLEGGEEAFDKRKMLYGK